MSQEISKKKKGDDRNLVETEAVASPELSIEDQAFLLWINHKGKIVLGIVAIAAGVVGFEFVQRKIEQDRIEVAQRLFAAWNDEAKLKAFAAENDGDFNAGAALLLVAGRHYDQGHDIQAKEAYDKAAVLLAPLKLGRAELGSALAQLRMDAAKGKAMLGAMVNDEAALPVSVRAEAAYNLAVLASVANDGEQVRRWTDKIDLMISPARKDEYKPVTDWEMLGNELRNRFPAPVSAATPAAKPAAVPANG